MPLPWNWALGLKTGYAYFCPRRAYRDARAQGDHGHHVTPRVLHDLAMRAAGLDFPFFLQTQFREGLHLDSLDILARLLGLQTIVRWLS